MSKALQIPDNPKIYHILHMERLASIIFEGCLWSDAAFFEDYADLSKLNNVDWSSIQAIDWKNCREEKQAEFLLEEQFPWSLVECIGVYSMTQHQQVSTSLQVSQYRPSVSVERTWYY